MLSKMHNSASRAAHSGAPKTWKTNFRQRLLEVLVKMLGLVTSFAFLHKVSKFAIADAMLASRCVKVLSWDQNWLQMDPFRGGSTKSCFLLLILRNLSAVSIPDDRFSAMVFFFFSIQSRNIASNGIISNPRKLFNHVLFC